MFWSWSLCVSECRKAEAKRLWICFCIGVLWCGTDHSSVVGRISSFSWCSLSFWRTERRWIDEDRTGLYQGFDRSVRRIGPLSFGYSMTNNFGSIDIIAIDESAHVVPSFFNLVNRTIFIFFMNRSTIWPLTLIMHNL
jgi:hypothetical protein